MWLQLLYGKSVGTGVHSNLSPTPDIPVGQKVTDVTAHSYLTGFYHFRSHAKHYTEQDINISYTYMTTVHMFSTSICYIAYIIVQEKRCSCQKLQNNCKEDKCNKMKLETADFALGDATKQCWLTSNWCCHLANWSKHACRL